jgi:hypothetical protein
MLSKVKDEQKKIHRIVRPKKLVTTSERKILKVIFGQLLEIKFPELS